MFLHVVLFCMCSCEIADQASGFVSLFDGSTFKGWHGRKEIDPYRLNSMPDSERRKLITEWTLEACKHWRAEAGELINDGSGPYLTTDRDFGDFELLVEYRTVAKADSGIYLKATPQVQIWDYTEAGGKWNLGAKLGSGGLYNNEPNTPGRDPLVFADRPFGEWNAFRIIHVGERTTVFLNDHLVVDHARLRNFWKPNDPLPRRGPIQLQTHGGEIRWRNIQIRELSTHDANARLLQHEAKQYHSLFNGRDFSGWKGPTENYDIRQGCIVCKPQKGGFIYTEPEFKDFKIRFEYRMPAGGNSGVALRYPGTGRASMVATCEIQLLDDSDPKYAKIDARQKNGSAYGLAPAIGGYDRPLGEWNIMEITAVGQHVDVELNGTRILHSDLSKFDRFMGTRPRPGQNRVSGHVAICGHRDPVEIRNFRVRKMTQTN